jgi:hypothetical protein
MADNDKNLTLGKGKLYFARFNTGTQTPGGERFIGNCTSVSVNAEIQTIEHRSSTEGRNKKDFEAVTGVDRALSIVTDNRGLDNVGVFALGMVSRTTIGSATDTEESFADVKQGLTYQLGTTATRPEGVRKVAGVVVEVASVAKTLNTDYTLDADLGRITIVSGGGIADLADIDVTYDVTAHTIDRIEAGATKQEGALRWVAANPDGPLTDVFIPWIRLAPSGELQLVSAEEFLNLDFSGEVMEKDSLPPWIATGRAITA